jgi:hypothetical protein
MSFLSCFFDCLYRFSSPTRSYTPLVNLKNEADLVLAQYSDSRRSEAYFAAIMSFLTELIELEKKEGWYTLDAFSFPDVVYEDVQSIRNIDSLVKSEEGITKLQKALLEALDRRIPSKILQQLVGDRLDVETVTKEGEEKKLNEYLGQKQVTELCSICLDPFSTKDFLTRAIHRTACHHFYHLDCVKTLHVCPNCRASLSFPLDQKHWMSYLDKVHTLVESTFSPDEIARAKEEEVRVIDLQADEAFARQLAEEYQLEEDARMAQIRTDARLAAGL